MCVPFNVLLLPSFSRLEDCVRDILSAANSSASDHKFTTPMEAISYITETHMFDKTGCYDPEPDDVAGLLRHIVSESFSLFSHSATYLLIVKWKSLSHFHQFNFVTYCIYLFPGWKPVVLSRCESCRIRGIT